MIYYTKVVFVCAPFRGKTTWEIERNVREAEELALQLWKMGAAAVCPHTNSRFFHGELPDDRFLNGYLEILRRCDAVIAENPSSPGCQAEVSEAEKVGIPVFDSPARLGKWLREYP